VDTEEQVCLIRLVIQGVPGVRRVVTDDLQVTEAKS